MKPWIIGITIVVGLSVTIWVLTRPNVVEPSPVIATGSNVGEVVNENIKVSEAEQIERNDSGPQNLEELEAIEFSKATSAALAFEAIEAAFANGNEDFGLWAESQLLQYCDGKAEMQNSPYEDTQWALDKLKDYCLDYDFSMIQRYRDSILTGTYPKRREKKSIENAMNGLSLEDKHQFLSQFIASAENPYEISAAFQLLDMMLEEPGTPIPKIGQDSGISRSDFMASLSAASYLLQCKVVDGCSSDSAQMLNLCFNANRCEPDWGVYELMEYTLSPLQMEQLLKIVEFYTYYGKG